MQLQYGSDLEDISTDEEVLAEFLGAAREREEAAADAGPAAPDFEPFEGEFDQDPDSGFGDEGGFADRIIPDSVFDPPKGRPTGARLRKDIRAKTAMFLTIGGSVWQARDEYCGDVFLETVPDLSDKLAAIFCDSPDIVRWFTASGKYMKWLDLAVCLQPVGKAVVAHHITHSADKSRTEPDWTVYAAS
jgi:hypothetical protein